MGIRSVDMKFQPAGIIKMIEQNDPGPYYACRGVDELLRECPYSVTKNMAINLFMLGYIEGKRTERGKRRKRSA